MSGHSLDKMLVKRLLRHDDVAFKEFFDLYFERLHRFAARRLNHDRETTKDVVQSTLTKAIKNMSGYRGEASLFTWLCTICRHEISDVLRKKQRSEERLLFVEDLPEAQGALDSLFTSESEPETLAQRSERITLIQVALDRLPTHYGNALEWKYIYGYSTADIAQRMGMGKEAVQSLLARARRAFHDAYSVLSDSVSEISNPGRSKA